MKKDKEMKDNLNENASTEPKTKAPKEANVKTSKKKSKMPEGYIGRPKPMRTRTFEFHKPTAKFYIGLTFFLLIAAFITYLAIRLVNVSKVTTPF